MSARDELMKKYGGAKEQKPKSSAAGSGIGSKVASLVTAATGMKLPEKKPARQTLVERYGSPDTEYAIRARASREGLEKYQAEVGAVAASIPADHWWRNAVVGLSSFDGWQEDWLEEFGYRYNTDPESAYSYAQKVNDYLAAERLAEKEIPYRNFAEKHPILATGAALVTSPFALLDVAEKGVDFLADGEISQRDSVALGTVSRTLTGAVAEDLNEKYGTLDEDIPIIGGRGWGDLYSLGNSALQSWGLGKTIGSAATLATFFGQGASSGMEEIKARGGSDWQAILYGLISGGAEALTEKLPLDNLLKGGDAMRYTLKGWLSNAAKQGLLEGGEELASSIANEMADRWIMGDKSNFAVRVQEYMTQGMDEEEAKKKAWLDYANDAAFDFIGGAASGAGSMMLQTGPGVLGANYQTSRTSTPESNAALIEQALTADEGTKPHKLAQKYQGAEKLTGGQINDLAAAYQEYETQMRYTLATEKAGEKLEELDAEDSTVATAIAKTLTGKDLNRRERRALERSAEGRKVLQDMQADRSWQQEDVEVTDSRDTGDSAEDPLLTAMEEAEAAEGTGESADGTVAENAQVDKVSPNVPDTNAGSIEPQAVDMAVEDVDDGDFAASESGKAVFDGKPVDIKGIADTKGDMTLELEDGRTVKASEVLYASEGEALVYEAVASLGAPADIGNILVKNYRDGAENVEAEDYAAGMALAFNHGRYNLPQQQMTDNPYIAKLTEVQRNSAYALGQRFGGKQVASQQAIARRVRFGQRFKQMGQPLTGRVHYDGDIRTLNARQRASVAALEKVAGALGVQVHLFESQVDENGIRQGENGWYNTTTGDIGIDIHAGISGEDTMLFTAAHELTHFIKQWSPAKFKVLANFLMEQYGEKGISVEELVEQQQAKALRGGRELSFDEAFEELVADSMETMLADGNVLEKLTKLGKQDRNLLEKLRDGLQELIQKIREVYKGLKPDSREGRYVAEMKDSLERLQELFTEALEDAGQNFQAAKQVKAEDAASSQQNAEGAAQVQRGTENVHSEATKANETEQEDFDWEEFDANLEFSHRDNEKTAPEGGAKYSLRIKFTNGTVEELENARDVSDSEMIQYLRDAKAGKLLDKTYIPVRRNTPQVLIDTLKQVDEDVRDLSMVMQVAKASQAMADDSEGRRKRKYGSNIRKHALKPEQIIQIMDNLNNPSTIIYQTNRHDKYGDPLPNNVAVFVEYPDGDTEGVAVIEFEGAVDPRFIGQESGETAYHIVVTMFSPDSYRDGVPFDYAEELLENPDNRELKIERRLPSSGVTRENHPNTSDELPSTNRVAQDPNGVNKKLSARDTAGRELTAEQQEYFQDSKVRDEQGRLMVMYHGTSGGGHTVFDPYGKARYGLFGAGSYFTDNADVAKSYTDKGRGNRKQVYDVYLNITNPVDMDAPADSAAWAAALSDAEFPENGTNESCYRAMERHFEDMGYARWEAAEAAMETIERMGYDGITHAGGGRVDADGVRHRVYIAFRPEQIKSVDNTAPTDNPDIRFSDRDPAAQKLNRALEKENAAQAQEIQYLRELVKLQGQVTNGTKFTRGSVRSLAQQLMKDAGAKGNYLELSEKLNGIYERIATQDDPLGMSWSDVEGQIDEAARWLVEHIEVKQDRGEYANDILRDLRGRKISLNAGQRAEVEGRYGSYDTFRKSMFGSVTISKDGTPLDMVWQELASQYPGTFDADIGDADMALELADVVARLRETDVAAMEFEMQRDGLLEDLRQKVYDGYWKVSTLYTVADKWQKKVDALKQQHQDTMKKLDKARQERDAANTDRIDSVKKVREQKNEAVKKVRQQYQESKKKSVEGRKKTALRHRIEGTVKELERLLLKGDKKRHIKEGMRNFVEEALASATVLFADTYSDEALVLDGIGTELTPEENRLIDETRGLLNRKKELISDSAIFAESEDVAVGDTSGFDKRMKEIQKLDRQISANMGKLHDVLVRERSRLNRATVGAVLANLSAAYRSLGQSDDLYIRGAALEEVWQHLDGLAETIGGATSRDLTLEQLEAVSKAFQMVLHTVRSANKLFAKGQKEGLVETSRMAAMEVTSNGKNSKLGLKLVEELKKFGFNNLKPVYFFEHLGSKVMRGLYKGLLEGQSQWAKDVDEARDYYRQAADRAGFDKWDMEKTHSFRAASGEHFKLNLQQMMSLYAYSRREQARDHIRKGGIVIDADTDIQEVVEIGGRLKVKLKGKSTDATAYNIDDVTLGEIVGKLTKEQKTFVEQMQAYLSDTMGGKGNEVSMELYGVKLFNEQNYLPIRSAHQYMVRAKEQAEQTARVKNAGFTKSTVQKASNPVVLTPFMDIWADHVNEMSLYHAMTLPLEDLHRVYTFSQTGDGGQASQSVTAAIENAFGKQATGYIDQLMKDLNGGARVDSTTGFINKSMALFKKGSTFLSASVVIQQPSAILRATALVDSKYFRWATLPGKWALDLTARRKQHDQLWAECKQYAPIVLIKEMGYFDTSVGRTTRDFIQAREYKGWSEKARAMIRDSGYRDEVLSRAPALADELAWSSIWEAVKREQHDKHPNLRVSSEEFLKLCGERFTEIIDKTQVYDSVLARSANMRSKDTGMKMATAFMAEPTVSANMVADAMLKGKRGDKKFARRAIGSVLASGILNAMLYSLVAAARDDDEDKEYWERYLGSVTGEVFEVINPATYLPFGRDIVSLLQGYDVERSDMALVADLINAIRALGSDSKTGLEKVEGFTSTTLKLFNLPLGNIWRDVKALHNVFADAVDGQGSTAAGIGYAVRAELPEWIPGGGVRNNGDQLYESILKGDKAHEERIRARFKDKDGNIDEGKARSALRKAIRENDSRIREAAVYLNEGQLLEYYNIVEEITGEGFFHKDDVVSAIGSEASSLQEDGGDKETAARHKSAFKAEHFAIAAADGDSLMMNIIKADLVLTAQTNGKTEAEAEKAAVSSIRGAVKEAFVDGDTLSEAQVQKALTGWCDATKEEAKGIVEEWNFEKRNGYALSELKDALAGGEVTADEAEDILVSYGGKTREEAELTIQAYRWRSEHPEYEDLSDDKIDRYIRFCKGAGISIQDFYEANEQVSEIKEAGGAQKDNVVRYIRSLPLSRQQKWAMWYAVKTKNWKDNVSF